MLNIILPTRNEGKTIGKMIEDIQKLPIESHIIVVDTESTDGTR